MSQFRKKPVVIEAVQFDGEVIVGGSPYWLPAVVQQINAENWMAVRSGEVFAGPGEIYIGTLEGPHKALAGDWIIRGVKGELYPCKPEIFAATYEPV